MIAAILIPSIIFLIGLVLFIQSFLKKSEEQKIIFRTWGLTLIGIGIAVIGTLILFFFYFGTVFLWHFI